VGLFKIAAIVDHRINDWDPDTECILCHPEFDKTLPEGVTVLPSERIKPKATDENWGIITTSQL